MNEKVQIESKQSNMGKNKKLKIFLIFLCVVIVGVTVFMILKKQKDIETGTSNPGLPNQAELSK